MVSWVLKNEIHPIAVEFGCAILRNMNDAYNILVIGLSILLAIYLILSIIVTVLVMRLVRSLREAVAKGEQLIDSAEAIGDTLRRNAGAVGIVRVLLHFLNSSKSTRRKG